MSSLYKQQHTVLRLLDRGAWKHSWHLPKDRYGYIDWWHPNTIMKVRREKEIAIKEAIELLKLAESVEIPEPKYDGEWDSDLEVWLR